MEKEKCSFCIKKDSNFLLKMSAFFLTIFFAIFTAMTFTACNEFNGEVYVGFLYSTQFDKEEAWKKTLLNLSMDILDLFSENYGPNGSFSEDTKFFGGKINDNIANDLLYRNNLIRIEDVSAWGGGLSVPCFTFFGYKDDANLIDNMDPNVFLQIKKEKIDGKTEYKLISKTGYELIDIISGRLFKAEEEIPQNRIYRVGSDKFSSIYIFVGPHIGVSYNIKNHVDVKNYLAELFHYNVKPEYITRYSIDNCFLPEFKEVYEGNPNYIQIIKNPWNYNLYASPADVDQETHRVSRESYPYRYNDIFKHILAVEIANECYYITGEILNGDQSALLKSIWTNQEERKLQILNVKNNAIDYVDMFTEEEKTFIYDIGARLDYNLDILNHIDQFSELIVNKVASMNLKGNRKNHIVNLLTSFLKKRFGTDVQPKEYVNSLGSTNFSKNAQFNTLTDSDIKCSIRWKKYKDIDKNSFIETTDQQNETDTNHKIEQHDDNPSVYAFEGYLLSIIIKTVGGKGKFSSIIIDFETEKDKTDTNKKETKFAQNYKFTLRNQYNTDGRVSSLSERVLTDEEIDKRDIEDGTIFCILEEETILFESNLNAGFFQNTYIATSRFNQNVAGQGYYYHGISSSFTNMKLEEDSFIEFVFGPNELTDLQKVKIRWIGL